MTELETVLLIALGVMLILWIQQYSHNKYYRGIIIAVGLGHARVEIDSKDKIIRIKQITNP